MELIVDMPIVHFKPTDNKKKNAKGIYSCPLYMYPVRTGSRERPSFMTFVDLKGGALRFGFLDQARHRASPRARDVMRSGVSETKKRIWEGPRGKKPY